MLEKPVVVLGATFYGPTFQIASTLYLRDGDTVSSVEPAAWQCGYPMYRETDGPRAVLDAHKVPAYRRIA